MGILSRNKILKNPWLSVTHTVFFLLQHFLWTELGPPSSNLYAEARTPHVTILDMGHLRRWLNMYKKLSVEWPYVLVCRGQYWFIPTVPLLLLVAPPFTLKASSLDSKLKFIYYLLFIYAKWIRSNLILETLKSQISIWLKIMVLLIFSLS